MRNKRPNGRYLVVVRTKGGGCRSYRDWLQYLWEGV